MLKNAYLYEEQIREAFYEAWYDPKYQYYFMGAYHDEFTLPHGHEGGDWSARAFASVDKHDNVIGLIGYQIEHEANYAHNFGAINFTDNKALYGMDLAQCVDDIFCKFGMNRLQFSVVVGNPIERSYDRMVAKYGGRVLCVRHEVAKDLAGNLCDDKMYEIMKRDYLKAKEDMKRGK